MTTQSATLARIRLAYDGSDSTPDPDPATEQDEALRYTRLLETLRRRATLVASVTIGGVIAMLALALALGPRYTAKAQLIVQDSRRAHTDSRPADQAAGPDQATMQTQVTALSSHDLLANVIAQLDSDAAFRAIERRGSGSLRNLTGARSRAAGIEELERHLHVFQESGSHVISVAYTSRDPAEAAAIANKIADYYLAAGEDQSSVAPDQAVSALNRKIADLRAESASLEAAVAAYQAAHGMNDASKINVIDQKLGDLNHQLATAQAELAARRTRHAELLASRGPRGDWQPLLAGLDARGLVELHGQVLAMLAGRQDAIVAASNSSAVDASAPAASQPLRDKVRKELDQALLKLSYEKKVASAQAAAIEQRLDAVRRASDDVQLHDLVTAATAARHRYERLVQRRDELMEQGDDVSASARLLSHAAIPQRPGSLSPLLFLPPGLVAFLIIGCLVALLRDRLDQGIYNSSDVTSALGVRCAGYLPLSGEVIPAAGMALNTGAAAEPFIEAVRSMLVSLQLMAPHRRKPQIILVTSSLPGEGKTTLALSVADCAARLGAKVLVLDMNAQTKTDLSAPAVPPPYQGSSVATVDQPPDRARIVVMPTGDGLRLDYLSGWRGPATELPPLLSGDRMSDLLRRQWLGYDLIFIDSASVPAKAEVRLLATIADQVLFAVRWRTTRRSDARAALALLRGGGPRGPRTAAPISVALTQVDLNAYTHGARSWARQLFTRRTATAS